MRNKNAGKKLQFGVYFFFRAETCIRQINRKIVPYFFIKLLFV